MANPTQFNRADGKGYAFVIDTVREIDAKNPQVASRIMTAFRSWRGLEPVRRGPGAGCAQAPRRWEKLSAI